MNWEFLTALTKAPRILSASIALGAAVAVAWSLTAFGLPSIDPAGLTFAFVGATALAFFLLSIGTHAWQHLRTEAANRIPPFRKLEASLQATLKRVFQSGNGQFIVPRERTSENWVHVLTDNGYIKGGWPEPSGKKYEITSAGWAEIEKAIGRIPQP